MSVQYLNRSTRMKIRPVSDEDVLFEMETNEFMTTCCRVNTSYDLVIRDITSGAMLFCISGAEIEDHPIIAYTSANHIITSTRPVILSKVRETFAQVGESGSVYVGEGCTVNVMPGLVTLDWSAGMSAERKALSIAASISLAMTKHQHTMFDGAGRPRQRIRRRYPVLLPPTLNEACPRTNRNIPDSIFAFCNYDQKFFLAPAGFVKSEEASTMFLMDQTSKQVLIHIMSEYSISKQQGVFEALHIDGKEQFTAIKLPSDPEREETRIRVQYNHRDIGQVTYSNITDEYKLTWNENGTERELFSKTTRKLSTGTKSFEDSRQYGVFNDWYHAVLDIKLIAGTSSIVKKLIICAASYHFGYWQRMFLKQPFVYISRLLCNCNFCQMPNITAKDQSLHDFMYVLRDLRLKVAGHNRHKNVLYLDVCATRGKPVFCTLEITPVYSFKDVAKIEGKYPNGSTAFTSIHHEPDELFSIYNQTKQLVAYITEDSVFNEEKQPMFTVKKHKTSRLAEGNKYGPSVKYYVYNLDETVEYIIFSDDNILRLYRPKLPENKPTNLLVFIQLTLAVKYFSFPYRLHRIPSPEIFYCYRR